MIFWYRLLPALLLQNFKNISAELVVVFTDNDFAVLKMKYSVYGSLAQFIKVARGDFLPYLSLQCSLFNTFVLADNLFVYIVNTR